MDRRSAGFLGRRWMVAVAVLVAGGCATIGAPDLSEGVVDYGELVGRIDEFLTEVTGRRVPGAAAVFFVHDRDLLAGGYGVRDRDAGLPVTRDTVFQVASISKTFTAFAVMRMVERGSVGLDDPVESHLRSFRFPESSWSAGEITIRRLLSHTAGLSLGGYPGFSPEDEIPSTVESLRGDTGTFYRIYRVGDVRVAREPGTEFRYSGGGYTVLQLLIEEVSGLPFDSHMADAVLQPLGMNASTFDPGAVDPNRLAKPYAGSGRELPNYVFAAKAAAGLYATADDLSLALKEMVRGYLGAGRTYLSPESYAAMLRPVAPVEGTVSIGLSFFLEEMPDGSVFAYHAGGNQGWKCFYGVNLQSGEGMVLLTNSDDGMARIVRPIMTAYRRYRGR